MRHNRDLRQSKLYASIEELVRTLRQPGAGAISDAAEISVSPSGDYAVFSGGMLERMEGAPTTRICRTRLEDGHTSVMTFGPNSDRFPRFSPDGTIVAFLSDRGNRGDFQLYLLDPETGICQSAPSVKGWIEYLHWSPDGSRILLGVAARGADTAGASGAVRSEQGGEIEPWMPEIDTGDGRSGWRSAWVYDVSTRMVRPVVPARINIWAASWCGNDALAAIVSANPGEGEWYSASLEHIEIDGERGHSLYVPENQLGGLAASPSGRTVSVIEAVCSDRGVVAGDLRLIDVPSGKVSSLNVCSFDITFAEWRSDSRLLLAGHRRFETVVGIYDLTSNSFKETWSSSEVSTKGIYATVTGIGENGDCALIGESFKRGNEIALIRDKNYLSIKRLNSRYDELAETISSVEQITWQASDGLEIDGWLLIPRGGSQPHPLIMNLHGGPVYHWRPIQLGLVILALLQRGFAIFLPNPRGSSGRGQAFAHSVVGDLGGADSLDLIAGIEWLVNRGFADPSRLGVTGASYGGYMTSWLISRHRCFAAAVSVAPVTNRVTQRLSCSHPNFVDMFVGDKYTDLWGKYFSRSPLMYAQHVKTPILNICGAKDRVTPPGEAVQFHNALLDNGVTSVLAIYPEEGHGIRNLPASIDYAARVVSWFEHYINKE